VRLFGRRPAVLNDGTSRTQRKRPFDWRDAMHGQESLSSVRIAMWPYSTFKSET
jgi:hypothetical protein